MYTTKGTIKVANATQVISEKFSKREFVIETTDQYPQQVNIQRAFIQWLKTEFVAE